ncbi:MAG: DUF1801 domain-containing protein [Gammaproteobacteria bacterium]
MDILVKEIFDSYPEKPRVALTQLRELIVQAATEHKVGPLEESVKWGEPSYRAKDGCAVRIDWKSKFPDKCFIFFQCQTTLVETFKEIYGDLFEFEGRRAIVFDLSQEFPEQELKHCISLSLKYQKVKHLPLLGA